MISAMVRGNQKLTSRRLDAKRTKIDIGATAIAPNFIKRRVSPVKEKVALHNRNINETGIVVLCMIDGPKRIRFLSRESIKNRLPTPIASIVKTMLSQSRRVFRYTKLVAQNMDIAANIDENDFISDRES